MIQNYFEIPPKTGEKQRNRNTFGIKLLEKKNHLKKIQQNKF